MLTPMSNRQVLEMHWMPNLPLSLKIQDINKDRCVIGICIQEAQIAHLALVYECQFCTLCFPRVIILGIIGNGWHLLNMHFSVRIRDIHKDRCVICICTEFAQIAHMALLYECRTSQDLFLSTRPTWWTFMLMQWVRTTRTSSSSTMRGHKHQAMFLWLMDQMERQSLADLGKGKHYSRGMPHCSFNRGQKHFKVWIV